MAKTHGHDCCDHSGHAAPALASAAAASTASSSAAGRAVYSIVNMDCPTEEALIRSRLASVRGVDQLHFDLMQRKLTVAHTLDSPETIEAALLSIGMQAVALGSSATGADPSPDHGPTVSIKKWVLLGLAGIAAVAAEITAWSTGNHTSWVVGAMALLAIGLSGISTYKKGWIAITNLNLNINALMAIAVTGALLLQQWPEAAMVMVLFTLAETIEALSLDRARHAIQSLMAMAPDKARVLGADGKWSLVAATQVTVGALVRMAPGERIPLDGVLTEGQSAVDQAPITGESMPVPKDTGDKVFAGTINTTGSFDYRVSNDQGHSTLSRIIHAVQEAQGSKAPTQRFVDQFSKIYTPIVCLVAVLVALFPPLVMGLPWFDWVYKALVLLVIACPCALVISTPVTVVSALAAAARAGILIKGGVYLEQGHKIKALALDKTGTITQGRPVVTDVIALNAQEHEGLRLAARLAQRSDHPVSLAISAYWRQHYSQEALAEVADFSALLGRGVKARVAGQWHFMGNQRLLQEQGVDDAQTQRVVERLESSGKTVVVISNETQALAVIAVADTVRDTSKQAIAQLHALGVHTVMLSGDNALTANAIAREVGIDDARGKLLPEDKQDAIKQLISQYETVGMVGDGINDAPGLAQASIGFAMGAAGTDTALETADVALMDDDLRKIPQFIRLSAKASAVLKQNIAIAIGIKAVFLMLAMMGLATLWMAVFADMGASLIVVFNGLRLLTSRK